MDYRMLGKTGLSVSALGFGAAPLGGAYGPITQDEATRTVRLALDLGVNFFYTRQNVAAVGASPHPKAIKVLQEILAPIHRLTWPSGKFA